MRQKINQVYEFSCSQISWLINFMIMLLTMILKLESSLEMESEPNKFHFKTSDNGFSSSLRRLLKSEKKFNSSKVIDAFYRLKYQVILSDRKIKFYV